MRKFMSQITDEFLYDMIQCNKSISPKYGVFILSKVGAGESGGVSQYVVRYRKRKYIKLESTILITT